jgi:ribosomal protein S18 acetylase RimI-like enzyme
MRKTTADLILRPRRPSDDAFIYPLSDRIFAAYSVHPTGSMASMLAERDAIVQVAERRYDGGAETPPNPPDSSGPPRSAVGAIVTAKRRGFPSGPAGFFVVALERLGRAFGPWARPAVARLNAIGVQPDLQGRGVGRFLLERAEGLARAEGAVSLTLMTADTNTRARRLFASAGFHQLIVIERAYARGQRGIVMTKAL